MELMKEDIEAKGYIYVESYVGTPSKRTWDPTVRGIIVYKDGFYGVLDSERGEEITPCVHLSKEDAIKDICVINPRERDSANRKQISIQAILKESFGEKLYSPYLGSIVRILFEILALPNSICKQMNVYAEEPLTEEQTKKAACALYETVASVIKRGGKRLTIFEYDFTKEFEEFRDEAEKRANGELAFKALRYYNEMTPEEKKRVNETATDDLDNYICFIPAVYQEIELLKYIDNSSSPLHSDRVERVENLRAQKPAIEINLNETTYYEDLHDQSKKVSIRRDAYNKGVPLELPEEAKKI